MNHLRMWKLIVLVILFICEAQSSSNDSTEYDLTNVLNEAILKILNSSDLVRELTSQILISPEIRDYGSIYKIDNTAKLRLFGNTINLEEISTHGLGITQYSPDTILWEFSKNNFHMLYAELRYWLVGGVVIDESYSDWIDDHRGSAFGLKFHEYTNLSIIATKLPENREDDKNIIINISYDRLKNLRGIELEKHPKLSYKQHLKLIYIIGLELPYIMRNFFMNGGNFSALLGKIFNLNPKQHIITACPDFLTNEQRYYYLLPDIFLEHMSFKNITIRGLSNFELYTNDKSWSRRLSNSSNDLVYTLHVKDVRGDMSLDHRFEHLHLPRFQLNIIIRNLYISFVPKTDEFRVEAQDYSHVDDSLLPSTLVSVWFPKYSTSIIQLIESALIDSLMPSKKEKSIPMTRQLAKMEASFVKISLRNKTIQNHTGYQEHARSKCGKTLCNAPEQSAVLK
ncbi:uncharacterized protein LOC135837095 isoform X2 [Planococcus citri]|uniref:uncharacterized protein LOC135837095 isoform X2 n=1 Tax=Planococcus citri TaxID=170843 RepID=UPI0031F82B54